MILILDECSEEHEWGYGRFSDTTYVITSILEKIEKIDDMVGDMKEKENASYSWKKLKELYNKISEALEKVDEVSYGVFWQPVLTNIMEKLRKFTIEHTRLFDQKAKILVQNGIVSNTFLDFITIFN